MKSIVIISSMLFAVNALQAQKTDSLYPDPEFAREVYAYDKSANQLVRLEKGTANFQTKMKLGGLAGADMGYVITGDKSPVRFQQSRPLTFVFKSSFGDVAPQQYQTNDPSTTLSLYALSKKRGDRNFSIAGSGGPFSKKDRSGKLSISVKQIRNGYLELIVDKPLVPGEYAFVNMAYESSATTSFSSFSFAIDP